MIASIIMKQMSNCSETVTAQYSPKHLLLRVYKKYRIHRERTFLRSKKMNGVPPVTARKRKVLNRYQKRKVLNSYVNDTLRADSNYIIISRL